MRAVLALALFGASSPALAGIADGAAPDVTWTGTASGGYFGFGVNGVGDVDGDGYDDIAVSATRADSFAGEISLFLGGAAGPSATADATWQGASANHQLGRRPVAGDFDSDGYSDLVLGASFVDSRRGQVDVYPGSSAGPDTTAALTLMGTTSSSYAGIGMVVGDLDCDGVDDLVLPEYARNRIQVYSGSSTGVDSSSRRTIPAPGSNSYFGQFTRLGDIDGDGCEDLITADYGWGSLKGKAWLFMGSSSGVATTSSWSLEGPTTSSWLREVAAGGDLNGDGYDDVAVGMRDASGTVQVFYGSASGLAATADVTLTGLGSGGPIPRIVPDMDGDGYDDLVVGDASSSVRIFRGSASGIGSTPDATLAEPASGSGFGYYVESAGDVNGDGLPDLIVGAPSAAGGDGEAYVYLAVADADGDGVFEPNDCDDADPDVGEPAEMWIDGDGDGWGDGAIAACPGDVGVAAQDGDCDDDDPDVFPGAVEAPGDEVDQDCDGAEVCYVDADEDGFRSEETIASDDLLCDAAGEARELDPAGDCDDGDAGIHPDAEDLPGDGIDQDCDGADAQDDDPGEDTGLDDDTGLDADTGLDDGTASDDGDDDKGDDPVGCATVGAAPMALGWLVGLVAVARRRS